MYFVIVLDRLLKFYMTVSWIHVLPTVFASSKFNKQCYSTILEFYCSCKLLLTAPHLGQPLRLNNCKNTLAAWFVAAGKCAADFPEDAIKNIHSGKRFSYKMTRYTYAVCSLKTVHLLHTVPLRRHREYFI